MSLVFKRVTSADGETLADWLCSETWPFHGQSRMSREDVLARFDRGLFLADDTEAFWLELQNGERAGLLRVFELGDLTPRFDLRIRSAQRGQQLGRQALAWLTNHVFATQPDAMRFEGQTREDNLAMRRVFELCGFQQEACYREAWPCENGQYLDAVGYAALRREWIAVNGTQ